MVEHPGGPMDNRDTLAAVRLIRVFYWSKILHILAAKGRHNVAVWRLHGRLARKLSTHMHIVDPGYNNIDFP